MLKKKIYFYQCFLCRPRNQITNQEAIQNQDQQVKMEEIQEKMEEVIQEKMEEIQEIQEKRSQISEMVNSYLFQL
jgi:predicted nuclease with TOPRIM domain